MTIRQPTKLVQVNLEPGGRALPFDDRDGAIHLALPRLEIHDIIVLRSN